MENNIYAVDYFLSRCPESGKMRTIYARIISALRYCHKTKAGVTMNELCEMMEGEPEYIRNIGAKTLPVILEECKNYSENKVQLNEGE